LIDPPVLSVLASPGQSFVVLVGEGNVGSAGAEELASLHAVDRLAGAVGQRNHEPSADDQAHDQAHHDKGKYHRGSFFVVFTPMARRSDPM
jgi:hypothetical protein